MGNAIPIDSLIVMKQLRYKVRTCHVLDGNEVYVAVLIVLEDCATGKIVEITELSKFLVDQSLLNKALNTRLGYAKFICMFLNYMFFDRQDISKSVDKNSRTNLNIIINLTIEDGNLFLNDYKNGRVGQKGTKTEISVQICEQRLTKLYHYLFLNYKMKYLKRTHFKIFEKITYRKGKKVILEVMKSPFKVRYPEDVPGRTKVEYISFFALAEFIDLAFQFYPMVALEIAIQAFTGLRDSEACNVTHFNSTPYYANNGTSLHLVSWKVDLTYKPQLRSDGVNVGEIKTPGIAMVHPGFINYFELVLNKHEKYIKETFKKENKYGAMFMNQNGTALTDASYRYAFKILVDKLKIRLSTSGDVEAYEESKRIIQLGLTPHSLRYFFTQYIASLPDTNIFEVAMFRRDSGFEAAMIYIRNNPHLIDRRIKDTQNKSMKKLGLYKEK